MTVAIVGNPSGTGASIQVNGVNSILMDNSGNVTIPGTFTSTSGIAGNLAITGSNRRITGNFSAAAGSFATRTIFQTNVADSQTQLSVMPSGVSTVAGIHLFNSSSDLENCGRGQVYINNTGTYLESTRVGTGTYLPLILSAGGTESMRIFTTGGFAVGSPPNADPINNKAQGLMYSPNSGLHVSNTAGSPASFASTLTGNLIVFYYTGGASTVNTGIISITATTTAYGTTSDHRLKENVDNADKQQGLDRINSTRIVNYNFISDPDNEMLGVLAHELQEVQPLAVIGEKDAIDEEGKPVYQNVDYSKLVPDLVLAVQQLTAEVAELKAQLAAST